MNASIGCLGLGMIVLFFIACLFIREINKHIAELKNKFEEVMGRIDYIRKEMQFATRDLNNEILKTRMELDDLKKKLESSEKSLDLALHLRGIEGSLKGMLDIVEEHKEALERAQNASEGQIKAFCDGCDVSEDSGDNDKPYADIPGDLDEGFEGEESATDEQREALEYAGEKVNEKMKYEWIFPSRDQSAVPIIGDEYLVIGRNREDNEIVTDVGTWKGLPGGFDMKEGYKLDRVYAYVRLPSPSDVMNEVLDIRFKE